MEDFSLLEDSSTTTTANSLDYLSSITMVADGAALAEAGDGDVERLMRGERRKTIFYIKKME